MNVILIGRNKAFLEEMTTIKEISSIIVIESKHVLKKLDNYENDSIKKVIELEYMNNANFLRDALLNIGDTNIDGVIPGFEYSVQAANELAEYFKLPAVGQIGAKIFTNKNDLREFSKKANIAHPKFMNIKSIEDLYGFFSGNKIILKPSNRQASLGISIISNRNQISEAFKSAMNVTGEKTISEDMIEWEYIAEEYLTGYEISSEYLVRDRQIIFSNITRKESVSNREQIEIAHHIPAVITSEINQKVHEQIETIIKEADVKTAVLHAEWKVNNTGPVLIECAARMPGDFISNGLSASYNFNFRREYIKLMIGLEVKVNHAVENYTIIQFFYSKDTGTLSKITNLELLENKNKDILAFTISKKVGDQVKFPESTWDRVGHFIISGKDYDLILKRKEELLEKIEFIVE